MNSSQAELQFFPDFPSKQTLKLLLQWHALYAEIQWEKQRLTLISTDDAIQLLDIPSRKLNQLIREGYLKQKTDGRIYKYQVLQLIFEIKQAELFESIR
jgi:hypothetical protein